MGPSKKPASPAKRAPVAIEAPAPAKKKSSKADVAARALRVSWRGVNGPAPDEAAIRAALSEYGAVVQCRSGPAHAVALMAKASEADAAFYKYSGDWKLARAGEALAKKQQLKASEPPAPATATAAPTAARADALSAARRATVKVSWPAALKRPPTENELRQVLAGYGLIRNVAVQKRNGLVMFRDEDDAAEAVNSRAAPGR